MEACKAWGMFEEKKHEYRLITAHHEDLSARVTDALGDGWTLHGSPALVVVDKEITAAQAVVRTVGSGGISL